jgi:predicted DNA-binding antitoxin AbrB/MazE fold protein
VDLVLWEKQGEADMTTDAIVQNGLLVPKTPLALPEGKQVALHIETEEDDPLLWLAAHAVDTGVTDFAEQHDHFIYGTPKREKQ